MDAVQLSGLKLERFPNRGYMLRVTLSGDTPAELLAVLDCLIVSGAIEAGPQPSAVPTLFQRALDADTAAQH